MTMLVSLGCRCHPAWWMRKLNIRVLSLPFDWLFSPPDVGLDYALQLHTNGFDGWLDALAPSALGHPVAARYPQVELFHHDALLSPDADVRDAERRRMARRAAAFADVVAAGRIDFLYCYPLPDGPPRPAELSAFDDAVEGALGAWPDSRLHVYFMTDAPRVLPGLWLAPRPRLSQYAYVRDQGVHPVWGGKPPFLREILNARRAAGRWAGGSARPRAEA